MKLFTFLCIIITFFYLSSFEEPWEWEDIELNSPQNYISSKNYLINFYQNQISSKSISRCPFYISCSNYATIAICKHGWFKGILYFIDRNFYRENFSAWYLYPFKEKQNGVLRLDDSYFLFENSFNPTFTVPYK